MDVISCFNPCSIVPLNGPHLLDGNQFWVRKKKCPSSSSSIIVSPLKHQPHANPFRSRWRLLLREVRCMFCPQRVSPQIIRSKPEKCSHQRDWTFWKKKVCSLSPYPHFWSWIKDGRLKKKCQGCIISADTLMETSWNAFVTQRTYPFSLNVSILLPENPSCWTTFVLTLNLCYQGFPAPGWLNVSDQCSEWSSLAASDRLELLASSGLSWAAARFAYISEQIRESRCFARFCSACKQRRVLTAQCKGDAVYLLHILAPLS